MGKYLKGRIEEILKLGTLGSRVLISDIFDDTVDEETFVTSIVATHSLSEFTQAVNDGPITVGVAVSVYTDAQIEAVIENVTSWTRGDLVAQEVSSRKVRIIGTFQQKDISLGNAVLNDGKSLKTKLNWNLVTGQSLRLWAYNGGASALATTDPSYIMTGHANLWSK